MVTGLAAVALGGEVDDLVELGVRGDVDVRAVRGLLDGQRRDTVDRRLASELFRLLGRHTGDGDAFGELRLPLEGARFGVFGEQRLEALDRREPPHFFTPGRLRVIREIPRWDRMQMGFNRLDRGRDGISCCGQFLFLLEALWWVRAGSADRALHLQFDESVEFERVFHREFARDGLDEAANDHRGCLEFVHASAHQVEELILGHLRDGRLVRHRDVLFLDVDVGVGVGA